MIDHLNGLTHISKNREQVFSDLAQKLVADALKAVKERGVFHLALSGGGTPGPFYQILVIDPNYRVFPWENTHIWIVDDRRVPEDDDRYNFKMIKDIIADHVPIPRQNVHPMPVLADDAGQQYEAQINEHVANQKLDFVVLGMGGDTHTASLFPKSPAINETQKLVVVNEGPCVTPPDRVTMTYPLLNNARELVVLAVGEGKFQALKRVSDQLETGSPDIQEIPISGINPVDGGQLTWFLDNDAAGI